MYSWATEDMHRWAKSDCRRGSTFGFIKYFLFSGPGIRLQSVPGLHRREVSLGLHDAAQVIRAERGSWSITHQNGRPHQVRGYRMNWFGKKLWRWNFYKFVNSLNWRSYEEIDFLCLLMNTWCLIKLVLLIQIWVTIWWPVLHCFPHYCSKKGLSWPKL